MSYHDADEMGYDPYDAMFEADAAQYDDDPSPYSGDDDSDPEFFDDFDDFDDNGDEYDEDDIDADYDYDAGE